MPDELILALDQSTSGSKAMVVDKKGKILSSIRKAHKQYYPRPGWVEHDPDEIYRNVVEVLREAVIAAKADPDAIKVLSLTNQRETVLLWDRKTGKPVYPAIVWQCRRTSDICRDIKEQDLEAIISDKTGLPLDPYFSSTKIKWILDNVEGALSRSRQGELMMGTIDSWLVWKLTGDMVHVTDFTNASRTMLYNIKTLEWDKQLLDIFGIDHRMLPEVKSSDEIFGSTKKGIIFDMEIPISGVIGDSQGALFGQNCFEPGMIKATYGTGTSVMMYTGKQFVKAEKGLAVSIAWGRAGRVEYALEGIIISTGDTLNWLKDNLGIIEDFDQVDAMAKNLTDNESVYLVPAFAGMGVPYWDMEARAAVLGLSRKSNKDNLVRAALESTAYQVMDAVELMKKGSGIKPIRLNADGGLTLSSFMMQFQADILGFKVVTTEVSDLSLMGSVYFAGLAVGIWENTEQIKSLRKGDNIFTPKMNKDLKKKYYNGWKAAVKKVLTI
ncbi:MAG: glycerol kinase GlpK [Candidatus Humimicrobiaceae bacterium]